MVTSYGRCCCVIRNSSHNIASPPLPTAVLQSYALHPQSCSFPGNIIYPHTHRAGVCRVRELYYIGIVITVVVVITGQNCITAPVVNIYAYNIRRERSGERITESGGPRPRGVQGADATVKSNSNAPALGRHRQLSLPIKLLRCTDTS